ncbi:MAG: M57 family metalloprotease [Myxococcota bacterium]
MRKTKLLEIAVIILVAGCGNETDPVGIQTGTLPSWEEFRASAIYDTEAKLFIVDGDIALPDEQTLRDYYELFKVEQATTNVRREALTVFNIDGQDVRWTTNGQTDITYCLEDLSDNVRQIVGQAMLDASRDWEAVADVEFVRVFSSPCRPNLSTLRPFFAVRLLPLAGQTLATAPFPLGGQPNDFYFLNINPDVINGTPPFSLRGILRHELGHVLGFRHEHIRVQANRNRAGCNESDTSTPSELFSGFDRTLTQYDSNSVMHFPQCGGTNGGDLRITALDAAGASALYGPPRPDRLSRSLLRDLYQTTLRRAPDQGGFDFWLPQINTSFVACNEVIRSFVDSPEYRNAPLNNEGFIDALYVIILNREPDVLGRNFWLGALNNGVNQLALLDDFLAAEQNTSRCAEIH